MDTATLIKTESINASSPGSVRFNLEFVLECSVAEGEKTEHALKVSPVGGSEDD